jgi:DNA-binding NarL/FixJ family response regulator
MLRVLIAEDHPLVRAGLKALLSGDPAFQVADEATDGRRAVALAEQLQPELMTVDLSMPGLAGLEVIRRVRECSPTTRMLVVSGHAEPTYVQDALQAGALGYLLKDAAGTELLAALRALSRGERYLGAYAKTVVAALPAPATAEPNRTADAYQSLTKRERAVFLLLVTGATPKEVAEQLSLAQSTVENYRARAFEKLSCRNVADATRFAIQRGLLR